MNVSGEIFILLLATVGNYIDNPCKSKRIRRLIWILILSALIAINLPGAPAVIVDWGRYIIIR